MLVKVVNTIDHKKAPTCLTITPPQLRAVGSMHTFINYNKYNMLELFYGCAWVGEAADVGGCFGCDSFFCLKKVLGAVQRMYGH